MATTHAVSIRRGSWDWAVATGIAAAIALISTMALVPDTAAAGSTKPSYGWPVKPFDRQHPVRAYFGDPRNCSGCGHCTTGSRAGNWCRGEAKERWRVQPAL